MWGLEYSRYDRPLGTAAMKTTTPNQRFNKRETNNIGSFSHLLLKDSKLDAQVHVSRGEVSPFERCHPTGCRCTVLPLQAGGGQWNTQTHHRCSPSVQPVAPHRRWQVVTKPLSPPHTVAFP